MECSLAGPCMAGQRQLKTGPGWRRCSRDTVSGFGRRIVGSGVERRVSGRGMPLGCSPPIEGRLRLAGRVGRVHMGLLGYRPCIVHMVLESVRGAHRAAVHLAWWVGSEATSWALDLLRSTLVFEREAAVI